MKEPTKLNILVIGGPRVGKTSLIRNFNRFDFMEKTYPTDPYFINVENNYKDIVSTEGWPVQLNIIDIGGCENFRILKSPFVINTKAVVICYDVTESKSWRGALRRLDDSLSVYSKVYFCGTKIDLISERCPREVHVEDVNTIARHSRSKVFETSASKPDSSRELFNTIIDDYVECLPAYITWKNSLPRRIANFFQL